MYKFKQFVLQAQKQKKCPVGYRFDRKLQICVPVGVRRYYPYLGGVRNNTDTGNQSSDGSNGNGDGNGNGNGNGSGGNGGNGNSSGGNGS